MNKKYKILIIVLIVSSAIILTYKLILNINPNPKYEIGQKLDSLNGIYVYYNGGVDRTGPRNLTVDGYNIGLTYQCVEFAKRYYYEHYKHKMPDAYGNAKDFFDKTLTDSSYSKKRDLIQFTNPSKTRPRVGDLIIFDGHVGNSYGHVAIISAVTEKEVEIIQQNPGPFGSSRAKYELILKDGKFSVRRDGTLGWLRKK